MSTDKDKLRADVLAALGDVTYAAEFVPQSKSRNATEPGRSLNWRVTLARPRGRSISTDYMQGIGHIPDHRFMRTTLDVEAYEFEVCEMGKYAPGGLYIRNANGSNGAKQRVRAALPAPDVLDVLACLLLDSVVLEYATFEEWAPNLGYDPDSRTGERAYRACLEIALALRALLGEPCMTRLRELLQDY
jgi:hypothetical protein